MIILVDTFGNHSNILLQSIHLECYCRQERKKLLILGNLKDFDGLYEGNPFLNRYFRLFASYTVRTLLKYKVFQVIRFDDVTESIDSIRCRIGNRKICFISGWGIRMNELTGLDDNMAYFANKYKLKKKYYENNILYNTINSTKNKNIKVVGLHVRRGDYKEYEGGRYYYSNEIYNDLMFKMQVLIQDKFQSTPLFIVYCNDNTFVPNSQFNFIVSENSWYIDQHLMSCCDYLIGPPSTFSGWASYIGKVQMYHIVEPERDFSLDKFGIMRD